jgi:hypothetical protein
MEGGPRYVYTIKTDVQFNDSAFKNNDMGNKDNILDSPDWNRIIYLTGGI